ncbi:hypothetical protein CRM22_000452 [Opisthorchis felineus]|uniref:C2 domain-containing protein n=1 Tax=Opisthorchis felineus TaxID=147828 RepID=A0A4S2MJN5_OPIFE|nr:hypothetical protein CRM22_000452 [Opisthorchis felineus]
MESILAKLAVYNSADMLRHIKQVLLSYIPNLPIGIVVIMTIMCVFAASLYSQRHVRKPLVVEGLKSCAVLNASEVATLRGYIDEWIGSSTVPSPELISVWLQALNTELASFQDELPILLHSIEPQPPFNFHLTQADTMRSGEFDESFTKLDVYFPLLVLRCQLKSLGCDTDTSVVLRIVDFSSKVKALITHNEHELLSVSMHLCADPIFRVLPDEQKIDVTGIKRCLLKALLRTKVFWKPASVSTVHVNQLGSPEFVCSHSDSTGKQEKGTNEVSTQASQVETSSNRTIQVFEPWNARNFPLRNAISVEGAQSTESATRLRSGKSLINGRDFRGPDDIFEVSEKLADISSSEGLEGILETLNGGTSSSSENPAADTPVVLAYNARVRQSITARELPRKVGPRLVRSASYYGENSPFKLHTSDEFNSNGTSEASLIGEFVPILPTSASTEVRLTDISPNKDNTDHLVLFGYHDESADSGERKTPQPEMSEFYQGEANPLEDGFPFKARVGEISAVQEQGAHGSGLACKKLLIKVVKAEGLSLKGTSNAYCVVELDEPYQRHTTHCSSAGQLFWDQHLLFDLNTNSKRIALEVFELFKRKKSVSKGRSELLLQSLFAPSIPDVDTDTESISTGIWDTSQFRRCLPLISRADPVLTPGSNMSGSSSPGLMTAPSVGTTTFNFAPGGIYQTPTITAEFHFMEKANEEVLAARLRASGHHLSAISRTSSSRTGPQSVSAQDSPILGCSSVPTPNIPHFSSLSHSTSLEFGTPSKFIPSLKTTDVITENEGIEEASEPKDANPSQAATLTRRSTTVSKYSPLPDVKTSTSGGGSPTVRTAQLFSPVPLRRAQLDQLVQHDIPSSPTPLHTRQKAMDKVVVAGECLTATSAVSSEPPRSPNRFEVVTGQQMFPSDASSNMESSTPSGGGPSTLSKGSPSDKPNQSHAVLKSGVAEGLQRTDSLLKRSNILGADESKRPTQRILLPFPDSDFDFTKDDSTLLVGSSGTASRSQSLASRLRTSRLLGSGALLRPGKRSTEESHGSSTNSLALLGPSRQLASVVAGLSSLPSESGTSPISAAALASAMAVAGATGSWQPGTQEGLGLDVTSPLSPRQPKSSDAENKTASLSGSHDPPLRYAPPAACVAAEIPGTYTPLSQPRRSDASTSGLFRLFRHKKKRFRSVDERIKVGMRKLVDQTVFEPIFFSTSVPPGYRSETSWFLPIVRSDTEQFPQAP